MPALITRQRRLAAKQIGTPWSPSFISGEKQQLFFTHAPVPQSGTVRGFGLKNQSSPRRIGGGVLTRLYTKDQKTIAVYIDEEVACFLTPETVLKHGLHTGLQITKVQLRKLQSENELIKWRDKALNFISFRPRSRKEVVQYLNKRHVDENLLEVLIGQLTEKKFIDDVAFAQWFVEQRDQFRPKGKKVLELELKSKGISTEIIKEVLKDKDEENELVQALSLIEKKRKAWSRYQNPRLALKIQSFLLRRGYAYDVTKVVLKRFSEDTLLS